MHVSELGTVALIEDQHDVPRVDGVSLVSRNEVRQFLNRREGLLRFWLSPRLLRSGERSWKDNGHADQVQRGVQA